METIQYTLRVLNIKYETADVVTITLKQPALKKIKYVSGQYLTLILRINGRRYLRPYSLSSSPASDKELQVTIKAIKGGIVSSYILNNIKEESIIEVLPPMGDFIFNINLKIQIVYFWGAGSGITPLFSIIKQILIETEIKVVLTYCNKDIESIIFYNQLEKLKQDFTDRFIIVHFISQDIKVGNTNFVKGRIAKENVIEILNTYHSFNNEVMHYICGPLSFKKLIKDVLNNFKVSEDRVLSEDFELYKNPEEFSDIETRDVKLLYKGNNHILKIEKGKSVLEGALDADLDLPYSCQTGSCNTCIGILKTGNLRMIGLSKQRDDLETDKFLLCCSYPMDNDVYIEIN